LAGLLQGSAGLANTRPAKKASVITPRLIRETGSGHREARKSA
jgi:hypothetical protein